MRINQEAVLSTLADVCNKYHISPEEVLLKGDCARIMFGDLKVVPKVELYLGLNKWVDLYREHSQQIEANHCRGERSSRTVRSNVVSYRTVKYFDLDDVRFWRVDGNYSIHSTVAGGYQCDTVLQFIFDKFCAGVTQKSSISKYCELFTSTAAEITSLDSELFTDWVSGVVNLFDNSTDGLHHIEKWLAAASAVDLTALNGLFDELSNLMDERFEELCFPEEDIAAEGTNRCAEDIIKWVDETVGRMREENAGGLGHMPSYSPRVLGAMYTYSPQSHNFDPEALGELSLSHCERFTNTLLLQKVPTGAVTIELFYDVAREFIRGFEFAEGSLNITKCFDSGKYVSDSDIDDESDYRGRDRNYFNKSRRTSRR